MLFLFKQLRKQFDIMAIKTWKYFVISELIWSVWENKDLCILARWNESDNLIFISLLNSYLKATHSVELQ